MLLEPLRRLCALLVRAVAHFVLLVANASAPVLEFTFGP